VPFLAVLSLPFLFAAGMSLMDTVDGAFMTQAYGWAFSNPIRKVYYNITVTSLSVAIALAVGSVELLQVVTTQLGLNNGVWGWLNALDFENLGYAIVGLFFLTWAGSVAIWKTRRIDERWRSNLQPTK
jgi:nickel/cobalt transporter (NiCoT) family protein